MATIRSLLSHTRSMRRNTASPSRYRTTRWCSNSTMRSAYSATSSRTAKALTIWPRDFSGRMICSKVYRRTTMSIPRKTFPIAQVDDVARAALPTDTAYRAVDFIETYTGRAFYPLALNIEGLTILDIAHALSNQCRYSGHVRFFFPTAQHCCLLAEWLVNRGGSALDALQILMHDAPEAYLVDVPRPIKQFMPQYRIWDFKINNVIREWMGGKFLPIPPFQDELDSRVIVDERAALFSASGLDWGHKLEPLGVRIEPWSPEHAEKQFLLQYAAY